MITPVLEGTDRVVAYMANVINYALSGCPKSIIMFDIPDDYKPARYLTSQEVEQTTLELKNHPLFMEQLPEDPASNPHLAALQSIIYD